MSEGSPETGGEMIPVADVLKMAKVNSLDELKRRQPALKAQRLKIKELEEELADTRRELDDAKFSGDPDTAALHRTIRSLEQRIDKIMLAGVEEDDIEEVMAKYPYIRSIPDKVERIQAVKDILALDQRGGKDAGNPPTKGRSKSEAAAQAHLTGGGPSASSGSSQSEYDRDFAKFQEESANAKTQRERDDALTKFLKKHPAEDTPI